MHGERQRNATLHLTRALRSTVGMALLPSVWRGEINKVILLPLVFKQICIDFPGIIKVSMRAPLLTAVDFWIGKDIGDAGTLEYLRISHYPTILESSRLM